MYAVEKHLCASLCALLLSSTTTSAWVVLPGPGAPTRAPLQRHTTALGAAKVGDYFNSGGGEDEDAAAAREARESLERTWANSASEVSRELDQGDDQLLREVRQALPELQGEGADGDSAMVSLAGDFSCRVVVVAAVLSPQQ